MLRLSHTQTHSHPDSLIVILKLTHTQTHTRNHSYSDSLLLRLIIPWSAQTQTDSHSDCLTSIPTHIRLTRTQIHSHTHTFSHSDPLKPRLTHAQTHHATIRSITDGLTLRLIHTQTHSHTDALALIFTHTHTHSNPGSIAPRLTHTQNQSLSDLLLVALILADCGNVSSERFALAHRRSLTDIHRNTYQDNEMHIWGAPRRVIIGGPRRNTHTLLSPTSPPLITQTHSSLRLTHHSYSLITRTQS